MDRNEARDGRLDPPPVAARIDDRLDGAGSLADHLVEAASPFADREAFRFLGAALTYRDLLGLADRFAAHLVAAGIRPGDRVALMMPNCPQYPVAMLGVLRAGAVVVNVSPLFTPRELGHVLADSGAVGIVLLDLCARTLAEARGGTAIRNVVTTGLGDLLTSRLLGLVTTVVARRRRRARPPRVLLPDAIPFARALRTAGPLRPVPTGPDDIAFLQYTGGTTGTPKGAILTNRNVVANTIQAATFLGAAIADTPRLNLALLPLTHVFALTANALVLFTLGGCSILIADPRDGAAIARAVGRRRLNLLCGTSTLFARLLADDAFRALDFSDLRLAVSGGMTLSPSVARDWQALTGRAIVEGYGLTEASPVLAINPPDAPRAGTAGLPVPSTEIRIVRPDGTDAPAGEPGEVVARGPQVMRGYWRNEEATAAVLGDGWLRTGDVGTLDADGFLRIVDRLKDVIIVGGFNVYPTEVEEVAATHEEVAECVALGIPDPVAGERVLLLVRPRTEAFDRDALRAHCRRSLAAYKIPSMVVTTTAMLPRNPLGKVLRRTVRDTIRAEPRDFVTRPGVGNDIEADPDTRQLQLQP